MRGASEQVRLFLEQLVASGEELGLQVAAYHRGKLVIDACAGIADPATGRKVDSDTLFTVFSTTKGIIYAAIHLLAERGRLSYDDPVARFWPAFAARGKQAVTVGQVMDHSAGVPQMPDRVDPRGHLHLGQDLRRYRRPPSPVGAGHEDGLPRLHGRVDPRRGGAPD